MNATQAKRLLKVARALIESPQPDHFTMNDYMSGEPCGTPSCALGHYAYRTDLQKVMRPMSGSYFGIEWVPDGMVVRHDGVSPASRSRLLEHFGITLLEAKELFDIDGLW